MFFIIVNKDDDNLAWSNELGWTEDEFDTFSEEEKENLNLPMGGRWQQVPWRKQD